VAPFSSVEVLSGHGLQAEELECEYDPDGHRMQASDVLEPSASRNVPGGHGVHETDALTSENDPDGHRAQSNIVGGRNVPTGQATQEPFTKE
jgi:hypothetical protein